MSICNINRVKKIRPSQQAHVGTIHNPGGPPTCGKWAPNGSPMWNPCGRGRGIQMGSIWAIGNGNHVGRRWYPCGRVPIRTIWVPGGIFVGPHLWELYGFQMVSSWAHRWGLRGFQMVLMWAYMDASHMVSRWVLCGSVQMVTRWAPCGIDLDPLV